MPELTRAALRQREEELLRSHQMLDAIATIQSLYIRDTSPRELFNEMLETLLRVTSSQYGFVGKVLSSADGQPYILAHAITDIAWNEETRALYSSPEESGFEFRNLETLFGATLTTGQPVISNEPASDSLSGDLPPGHPAIDTYLGLPLYSGKIMVGVIGLANRAGGYDAAMIEYLNPLSRTCGQLIQACRNDRERKQALSSLRESETRYKTVLETVVDGIIIIDEKGSIESFNPAAERIFGYHHEEVIGQNVSILMPEPYHSQHDDYLAHYLHSGQARIIGIGREVSGRRKDGSTFPMELAIAEMHFGGQRHFNGIVRDISERKRSEQLLQETTALQSAILDSANYAIISTDPDGTIRVFNRAAEHMTGHMATEMVGKQTPRILHDPEEMAVRAQHLTSELDEPVAADFNVFVAKALRGPADENEWSYIRKDGSHFPVLLSVTAMRDDAGNVTGFLGIAQDISEPKQARAQLERLSSELRAIFDLSPDGFVAFTELSHLAYANPAFLRMVEFGQGSDIDMNIHDFDNKLQALCDPAYSYIPAGSMQDNTSDILHLIRPRPAILKRSVRDIHGETGGFLGRVLYFLDITHETEVDRMKTEFLSTAAHELRTPMASIHGFSELLLNHRYEEAIQRDLLETIYRQSSNLIHLVNELLDLARIEARAGKDFYIQIQDLLPILERTVHQFIVPNDPRKITLRIDSTLYPVAVDAQKLSQMLLNVISNAYKYSPGGGAIELATLARTMHGKTEVGISVRDHGIGMTPEQVAKVFDRFYRVDTSGAIPGTGLGMSLVKEIMEIHKGYVEINSVPGKGTEVVLWLPAAGPKKRNRQAW